MELLICGQLWIKYSAINLDFTCYVIPSEFSEARHRKIIYRQLKVCKIEYNRPAILLTDAK